MRDPFVRIDGRWECPICTKQARDHTTKTLPYEGGYVQLCDGRVGKL